MSGKPSHGLSYTPEYKAWQTLRLRCTVPTNPAYKDYGARGITVCDRWVDSVENFLADMGAKPSPAHELDRENNDKGYSPENCRWVTRKVNDRNRRSNRMVEYKGETQALVHWCERFGIRQDTAKKRLDAGWTPEKCFGTAAREKAANGQAKPLTHPCATCDAPTRGALCRVCENKARPARVNSAHEREIVARAASR
ncbi:hypothetical protein [Massilia sp. CCM 8734]|uniref:hypothetical protein n=1 Tax=Massilia sp. CCM 8734 TaxID=2609283 RepID=UPI0014215867|nr:hypothetical protein [Massilia sp. CCM 8734]NHZ94588.1 hypothetical protein [Massilia sp. CCM 8734]